MFEIYKDIEDYRKTINPADYVPCVRAKGLEQKWKLNIGYFLTSSIIKVVLYKLI